VINVDTNSGLTTGIFIRKTPTFAEAVPVDTMLRLVYTIRHLTLGIKVN